MTEVAQAEQVVIFLRHGETPANQAREDGDPRSRVQGACLKEPISEQGEQQAMASGPALRRFLDLNRVELVGGLVTPAERGRESGRLAIAGAGIELSLQVDQRLIELRKGNRWRGGLEGRLRSKAYSEEDAERMRSDWHFRHGTRFSGGETAWEAGNRWLSFFHDITQQSRHQQRSQEGVPGILAVGHNLVTSYGVWMLLHHSKERASPLPSLRETEIYRAHNGTALVLAQHAGAWSVAARIVPTEQDLVEGRRLAFGRLDKFTGE